MSAAPLRTHVKPVQQTIMQQNEQDNELPLQLVFDDLTDAERDNTRKYLSIGVGWFFDCIKNTQDLMNL